MRRLLKFLHTLGAAGFMGGLGALAVLVLLARGSAGAAGYVATTDAMARVAAWIVGPSMVLTVIAGLLAIAAHPGFHDAGWAWAKAATGILILEGGLHVLGSVQEEVRRGAGVLASGTGSASVARLLAAEGATLWLLLAVSAANVALGVWRPRLARVSA